MVSKRGDTLVWTNRRVYKWTVGELGIVISEWDKQISRDRVRLMDMDMRRVVSHVVWIKFGQSTL